MEKVVYLLGAGFSAPLGIPVMSNFLTRSKDLYFTDPERFAHFSEVFETINELSVIKNYYFSDLFNIEEILSILEMRDYLEGQELKANFTKYLVDVVKHYTPEILRYGSKLPGNWEDVLFGRGRGSLWAQYGHFVGAVCNLTFAEAQTGFTGEYAQINCRVEPDPKFQYSIVTLNYDCVPESVLSFVETNYNCATPEVLRIAKLHGSVDSGEIVPPTWNKGANRRIVAAWKRAYEYIVEANHLRIIGYSLPTADAYVKYLLKSAVTKSPHLKAIDVVCLDNNGSVKRRYDAFVPFTYYQFCSQNVSEYLAQIQLSLFQPKLVKFDIEKAHKHFFQ
jgi:hypothetical protein